MGTTPQGQGHYPDYDVMALASHWDDLTREMMEDRISRVPTLRFFTPQEARTLGAFLDVVLAQDCEPRVPVLNMVDAKFAAGKLDGYRYENMPEDPETWRIVARELEGFADSDRQEAIVDAFSKGELDWEIDCSRAWSVVMRAALSAFYSHPWAFNEIGFGGPAYPRGYMRRNMGPAGREPYEPAEVRR